MSVYAAQLFTWRDLNTHAYYKCVFCVFTPKTVKNKTKKKFTTITLADYLTYPSLPLLDGSGTTGA